MTSQRCGRLARYPIGKLEQIEVEPGIAVQQKKQIIEAIARMPECAADARALWLDCDFDLQAEPRLQRC